MAPTAASEKTGAGGSSATVKALPPRGRLLSPAGYLAVANTQRLFLTIVSAGFVYSAVLLIIASVAIGGPRQLKARYLQVVSH